MRCLTKQLLVLGAVTPFFPRLALAAGSCGRRGWDYTVWGAIVTSIVCLVVGTLFQAWIAKRSLAVSYGRALYLYFCVNVISLVFVPLLVAAAQLVSSGVGSIIGIGNPLQAEDNTPPTMLQGVFHSYVSPGRCEMTSVRIGKPLGQPRDAKPQSPEGDPEEGWNVYAPTITAGLLTFVSAWLVGWWVLRREARVPQAVARRAALEGTVIGYVISIACVFGVLTYLEWSTAEYISHSKAETKARERTATAGTPVIPSAGSPPTGVQDVPQR